LVPAGVISETHPAANRIIVPKNLVFSFATLFCFIRATSVAIR
jgi:hypothetical protein